MEKTSYEEELTVLERQNLRKSMEKLKADASGILFCTRQLKVVHKHNEMVEANSIKKSRELEFKEKELQSLSSDLDKRVRNFEEEKTEAGDLKKLVEECTQELRSKRNESARIQTEIELKEKQLVTVDEQLEAQQRLLKIRSSELVSKERQLERVRESIRRSNSDLELKENKVQSLNHQITVCGKTIDSKSEESREIQKLIEQKASELVAKEKRHKEILETICRSSSEMEERAKEIKAAETEAIDLNVRSERFRQEIEGKEKELDLLKNQIESEEKNLVQLKRRMEEETDSKKKDLVLILSKIEESGRQLESQGRLLEIKSVELVSKEMELERVGESSNRFKIDLEVKEKRFQALNNLITISGEQLNLKSKELGEIQREIELMKQLRQMSNVLVKREKQPTAAPINNTSQQNAGETEPVDEDTLMLHGISASLTRHEVSSFLRASPNPAEFVLELVQEEIREGSDLQDSFSEILALLFEELAKIQQSDELAKTQRPDKSQLQLKAAEVATLWKENITIEAPKSTLEALAFLLFIVAYGLKTLINEEETALLASSIAQYEQAPRLFNYLSLNPKIREFVRELIKKSQYIPAVRLICLFKLNKELSFSPSELLEKEIINFRRSVLENRSTESPQGKDNDAGRLRAILELVADYKLEIDLPGELIAKLMVERESSTPLVRCSVEHDTSAASNPQAELKKKQLVQTKTVLVKHNGLTLPVMSSDVHSINETSKSKHPPVIYTYQRRGN